MSEKRIKVVMTPAGSAWNAQTGYRLLDYIADGTCMWLSVKTDPATGVNKGHALGDKEWWSKCIDMTEALDKAQEALDKGTETNAAIAAAETGRAEAERQRAAAEQQRKEDTAAAIESMDAATAAAVKKAETAAAEAAATANAAAKTAEAAAKTAEAAAKTATETNAAIAEAERQRAAAEQQRKEDTAAAIESAAAAVKTVEGYDARLSKVEDSIGDIGLATAAYYVASRDAQQASPSLGNVQTNRGTEMLENLYRPWLVDHRENTGAVMPADELRRNNWFRREDGSWAPAVVITEEMRAETDAELYLDAEHTERYCGAGEFDAARFYREYGMEQKLYDAAGGEIGHILRPWETTEKNYSIKVGAPGELWLLDGISAEDGREYKGVMRSSRVTAGLKPRRLSATLMSPGCDTTIKDADGRRKMRSMFCLYNADDANTGSVNGYYGMPIMKEAGAFPRVNDVSAVTAMDYARNNNADPSKPYPWAEAGYHAYNTFVAAHELLYGTNYINDPDRLFSSGTSSVDACGNEAQWRKYGGVRYRKAGSEAYTYKRWSEAPADMYRDAAGTKITDNFSLLLNQYRPKWLCNEAQTALSWAAETGIAEDTEYVMYGRTYRYTTPPGAKGLADGYMNAIVYRRIAGEWQGYDADGNAVTWEIEVMLRNGVMDGMVTSGDIFHYRSGGLEMVSQMTHPTSESYYNYPTDLYIETDQTRWHSERVAVKDDGGTWDFERDYEKIGHIDKTTVGYMKTRAAHTPHILTGGASLRTYVCGYADTANYWATKIGTRARRGARCGGLANWADCASRHVYAADSVSHVRRFNGCSAQCLFVKRSAPQAQ